jgi:hypothetical protein
MLKSPYVILAALSLATGFLPLTSGSAEAACRRTDITCPPPVIPDPKKPDGDPDPGDNKPFEEGPTFVADTRHDSMLIACRVSGTPEGLPNDLKFRNIGDRTIPAGTRVYWMISETKEHGWFVLPQDLLVGKSILQPDVLAAGLPTTDHCYSKIM